MLDNKQLKKGKFYYRLWANDEHYIMRASEDGSWMCDYHLWIKPKETTFTLVGDFSYVKIDREATDEEQHWLERCIAVGHLVERTEDIPQYQIY